MRIISLLPSATEMVACLGLQDQLVGVSHECDYPPMVQPLPKVTTTLIPKNSSSAEIDRAVRQQLQQQTALYSLDMEVLTELQPDLIVTQALCDVCAVAGDEVMAAAESLPNKPEILNLEPMSLADVFSTLILLGKATGREDYAEQQLHQLQQRVTRVVNLTDQHVTAGTRPKVAFFEWVDPLFNAGHWTPELIEMAGGMDLLGRPNQPSVTIEWEQVVEQQPDVLFIAPCGFEPERGLQDINLLESYPGYSSLPCVQNKRVYLVDGNAYFNRPGPRLVDSLELLAHSLHPDVHPAPEGIRPAIQVA